MRLAGTRVRGAIALVLAAAIVLSGVGSSRIARAQDDNASVRIVHGIADAGPLDVYVDGAVALIGITFAETSGDVLLTAGEHELAVVPSGAAVDDAIVAGTIALDGGSLSYVTLIGAVDLASVGLYAIDTRPLDPAQARFRVINGSPDSPGLVPAFTGGDAISPLLAFGDASEYATIAAGAYDVDVLEAASGVSLLALPQTVLAEGMSTDLLVVGLVADGTLQALSLTYQVPVARVVGRTARVVSGLCDAPGDVVADVAVVRTGQGEAVGAASGRPVENGYGLAPVSFGALIGAAHAIVIAEGEDATAGTVACGVIGGQLTDTGALVIALDMVESGMPAGVAVLAPSLEDPEATGISVFLVVDTASTAATGTPPAGGG